MSFFDSKLWYKKGIKTPSNIWSLQMIFCQKIMVNWKNHKKNSIQKKHQIRWVWTSDGSGSKIFGPCRVGSIFCGSGWFSHLWFGFEFGNFPLKMSNFSIFSLRVKKSLWVGSKAGQPLIYCGSKVSTWSWPTG